MPVQIARHACMSPTSRRTAATPPFRHPCFFVVILNHVPDSIRDLFRIWFFPIFCHSRVLVSGIQSFLILFFFIPSPCLQGNECERASIRTPLATALFESPLPSVGEGLRVRGYRKCCHSQRFRTSEELDAATSLCKRLSSTAQNILSLVSRLVLAAALVGA
jgi:hypothetical protein